MKQPRVVSIGLAFPNNLYTQREIFDELGYPERFWKLFNGAGVEYRCFVGPINTMRGLSFQEQQEWYLVHSLGLSIEAINSCLDKHDAQDIGALSYSSCTGVVPGPVMGDYIAEGLKLNNNTYVANNLFQGCDGAFPGLHGCLNYTRATGRPSLVVSCELCSCTYYPETRGRNGNPDPENDFELLRAYSLFADAASCALIAFDDGPDKARHPRIIDTDTYLDTRYLKDLGYRWENGRLRIVLSRRVPDIASYLVTKVVNRLLEKHSLNIEDIRHWVVHPAGAIVLDLIRDKLGLPEQKLAHSRRALEQFGNCSSATVGIVAQVMMESEPELDGYAVMVNVGPGMRADATLLKFGEDDD